MELLENFGFEPVFFSAQIVNFLILAFVFKKFLYKPILKILNDRQQKITKGLEDTEAARLALDKANAKKDEIIKNAVGESRKIIDETKKSVQKLREELTSRAKIDAQRLITQAKTQAQLEMDRAEAHAKNISLDLAKSVLEKVLSELFTKQEKDIIIQRNIKKLGKL